MIPPASASRHRPPRLGPHGGHLQSALLLRPPQGAQERRQGRVRASRHPSRSSPHSERRSTTSPRPPPQKIPRATSPKAARNSRQRRNLRRHDPAPQPPRSASNSSLPKEPSSSRNRNRRSRSAPTPAPSSKGSNPNPRRHRHRRRGDEGPALPHSPHRLLRLHGHHRYHRSPSNKSSTKPSSTPHLRIRQRASSP